MGIKRGWFRRRPSDDEMREELEAHVAMRAEHDRVDEAAARRRLGNVLRTRESMRRVWIAEWWEALRQDAHFTWRLWRRRPAFALAAILVLGLGLGASTALFAALDRVLFRPLPYADPDRLVSVGLVAVPPGGSATSQTESMVDRFYVQAWDTTPAPFQAMAAMAVRPCQIAEVLPEGLRCGPVESNFLRLLGVRVALGRDFAPEDDVRGAPRVALISHALWVRRYGADPGVVDRTLNLETVWGPLPQVRIVGVLPRDFEMPLEAADLLLPAQLRPLDPNNRILQSIVALARLRPGVTPERAEAMLAPQSPEMRAGAPRGFRNTWRVRPLHDRWVGDAPRVAWLLLGAVAALLLIACVNVANLMLARAAERQREFAVRAAIGAGGVRLARLAISESLLLAVTAGCLGLFVALALLKTFVAMMPPGIPGVAEASIDFRVFVVAALLVVVTGVTVGLWPAISVFRAGGVQVPRAIGAAASPGTAPSMRFALVTTQIALTVALLGGSALLLRSLWNLVTVPLGFDAEPVVTLTTTLGRARYPTTDDSRAFFEELLARSRAMPGTLSAALSDAEPPPRPGLGRALIGVEGRAPVPGVPLPGIGLRHVTPHYLETFRIPLVTGRTFHDADRNGEPAVVLNESAVRVLFPGERTLGRRIGSAPGGPWHTVIGVAADVRNGRNLTDEPVPEIYMLARPDWGPIGRLSIRTAASPADATAFLRQIAADLDPRQLVTIQTNNDVLTTLTAQPRFIALLLTAFATLALLLAAAGLYSVASYLVTQRRRDIGVHMALGASPRDVARQVVGEAGRWIMGGAVIGSALGWMGTRALQSQLYQVEALDPWSWTGAMLTLAVVLVTAVFRPAYRAAHVDPVTVLRAD